jgi:hypothetical protein
MNKIILGMISLIFVLLFAQVAETSTSGPQYDLRADSNRDGVIDVLDLARLGNAYGSIHSPVYQPNKTIVQVLSLESDPAEVENARVAIIDPNSMYQAVQVGYTNLSGLVDFTLNTNANYTAIAWSSSTYNYANFTTNAYGEASISMRLSYPHLPPNLVPITFVNTTSGALVETSPFVVARVSELVWDSTRQVYVPSYAYSFGVAPFKGILIFWPPATTPSRNYIVTLMNMYGIVIGRAAYTPDENGNANVVVYV